MTTSSGRLEPPDGGWGILVCIGLAMPFACAFGALPSFGLVFGDFLKSTGAETSAIALILSIYFTSFSCAGLLSGPLFRRFARRKVGLIGALLYFLGSMMQIFAASTFQLTITFGLLQGGGFGLILQTSYTTFNYYFVKKRVMWMSFAQSLIGLGTMSYPMLMHSLLEWYGFRGCVAIVAAINSHAILGMLLMQPVEWHMKLVPIPPGEAVKELKIKQVSEESSPEETQQSLIRSHQGSLRYPNEQLKLDQRRTLSATTLDNCREPMAVKGASEELLHVPNSKRQSVIFLEKDHAEVDNGLWQKVVDFLDLTLLKQPVYVNIVLGMAFALYSDNALFALQPLYLFELQFSKPEIAKIIAIGAAADLVSRIFLAVCAIFIQVPPRYIYLAGSSFSILNRIAFMYVYDYMGMAIITAIMGFLRSWVHVPISLVLGEYLGKERFASGCGLFMFIQGNVNFIIGPAVGYLRDATQSYPLIFHCLNFIMGLCAVPWLLEIIYLKFKQKNKVNVDVEATTTS